MSQTIRNGVGKSYAHFLFSLPSLSEHFYRCESLRNDSNKHQYAESTKDEPVIKVFLQHIKHS